LASRVEVPRGGVLERKVPTVCCAGNVKEEEKGEEEDGKDARGWDRRTEGVLHLKEGTEGGVCAGRRRDRGKMKEGNSRR
jgi:hypothetical protein